MADHLSSPPSSHGEERRFIAEFDEEEISNIAHVQEMRRSGRNVSTSRAKGLHWFSVFCIIANRMIGTGIFRTSDTLMRDTESIPASMLFWLAGMMIALAGTMVYIEFGLAIPRLHGESIPRNGGEKNYLEYAYSKESQVKAHQHDEPSSLYKSHLLATCLYGIPFICLGNMAANAILFGENILIACGSADPANGPVRVIAVGVATFACALHIVSRWAGIALNNFFGSVKAVMLLMLIVVGIISFAGGLSVKTLDTAKTNYGVHGNFDSASRNSYGYAASFLSVIFAYGGFNQANYVLGTIYQPRRRFKVTALVTVTIVSVLYVCLNLCYFGVVPYDWQIHETNRASSIATDYFNRTLMSERGDAVSKRGKQAVAAFMSFSSLGNIIVQTFTAARVKQELAKEGILPWSKFFARNRSWHWRFWQRATRHNYESPEATPVGALLLHWVFSISLILGTYSLSPTAAYQAYVGMYSFTIDALFGFFVGLALLILRTFNGSTNWSTISSENKWVSIACAIIFTIGNAYPLAAIWVPPRKGNPVSGSVSFWVTGTVGLATVAFGALYWVGIRYIVPWWLEEDLVVERRVITGNEGGETVVLNEIVSIQWEDRSP